MSQEQLLTEREAFWAKLAVSCFIKPLELVPISWRGCFGRLLGRLICLFNKKERTIAALQIKWRLPELNADEVVVNTYAHFGEVVMESINLNPVLKNIDKYIECPNSHIPKNVKDYDRPVIALTAHMGNWELMAAYMVKVGVPLTTVGRQARNKYGQYILAHLRSRYGVNTMWKEDRSGLRDMVRALTPGHTIAALIDQDTQVRSKNYEFMGHEAKTPIGLIEIGQRYNAVFVTSFVVKDHGKHIIHVEEIPDGLSLDEIIGVYNQRLEKLIREYPDQWIWMHKRWRNGIYPNQQLSSKEYVKYLRECNAKK